MLTKEEALISVYPTFKASIRSVGTACTLASVGVYLHRRNFVAGEGKKTLALIAQQVTIPLLLFTKIIFCNQDWSSEPCPDITKSLEDVWLLLIWPIYVVGWGLLVGWLAARISKTPRQQVKPVLVACSFSNCTGLPITLLSVVHANFPSTSDLGRIDPTLFLSVYLLLYPILQWGIGGWLLAPEVEDNDDNDDEDNDNDNDEEENNGREDGAIGYSPRPRITSSRSDSVLLSPRTEMHEMKTASISHNVLNNKYTTQFYKAIRRGINETDASMYISSVDLTQLAQQQEPSHDIDATTHIHNISERQEETTEDTNHHTDDVATTYSFDGAGGGGNGDGGITYQKQIQAQPPVKHMSIQSSSSGTMPLATERSPLLLRRASVTESQRSIETQQQYEEETLRDTVCEILTRCLQPPVVGAMAGIFVAATPLRGIFVDLKNRSSNAPLQWFFDGLYSVGQAAVPLNMMILGTNVSSSLWGSKNSQVSTETFSNDTMMAIVLGKMVVMPMIGVLSAYVLKHYLLTIPDSIEGSFYLVLMIVFITPTANNVMVMVELSGGGVKEGMARVIMLQYAVAPIILCLTMSVVVGIASGWS